MKTNPFKELLEFKSDIDLKQLFYELLEYLELYLDLDPAFEYITVDFNFNEENRDYNQSDILEIGAKRILKGDTLNIKFFSGFEVFLPFILLREAYFCFIPKQLFSIRDIKVAVNHIVLSDLNRHNKIEDWESLISKDLKEYRNIRDELNRIDTLIRVKNIQNANPAVSFFFRYLRENLNIIKDNIDDLYDDLFREFVFSFLGHFFNDELVETVRILTYIFYNTKSFTAVKSYKELFLEYKDKGLIKTNLSPTRFEANIKWLNRYRVISPSYSINYRAINIRLIQCITRFHPRIKKAKINAFIEKLPFFLMPRSCELNFSIEIYGLIIIPEVYLKDLQTLFFNLKRDGVIINYSLIDLTTYHNYLNLNFFRDFHDRRKLLNPNHKDYDEKYEIVFTQDFQFSENEIKPSLLEFLILDRVWQFGYYGFSFESQRNTLKMLKKDIKNELLGQVLYFKEFELIIQKIRSDNAIIDLLINLIANKKNFFLIRSFLEELINFFEQIPEIIYKNNIKNIYELRNFIKQFGFSKSLKSQINLFGKEVLKFGFREFIPLFFNKGRKKYFQALERFKTILDYFNLCFKLKILNLNVIREIISNDNLINKVIISRKKKIEKLISDNNIKRLKISDLNGLIDKLINYKPPIIKPTLINTLSIIKSASYYFVLAAPYNQKNIELFRSLRKYFPRVLIFIGNDLTTHEKIIIVEAYIPDLLVEEKAVLASILYNSIEGLKLRRLFYDGIFTVFSNREYYDFARSEFLYTEDLFKELYNYVRELFDIYKSSLKPLKILKQDKNSLFINGFLESKKVNMNDLLQKLTIRISKEKIDLSRDNLYILNEFFYDFDSCLKDINVIKSLRNNKIINKYLNSITFKPIWNKFGLSEYTIYLISKDYSELDLRLLLQNTFLSVKIPVVFPEYHPLIIKYIFPKGNPNKSYINWLIKSKKNIIEYCLFTKKSAYFIFRTDRNLSSSGWVLNTNRFQSYIQNLLFNPDYNPPKPQIKKYDLTPYIDKRDNLSPDSDEFNSLKYYFKRHPENLRILMTIKPSLVENLIKDFRKGFYYPRLKFRNLGIIEKLTFIIPDIEKDLITRLIEIFSYFNLSELYEIEGEYYLDSMNDFKTFENGLMVKLYLPAINLSGFTAIFESIFGYFNIKYYLIWFDLIDGENYLKKFFGKQIIKNYHPLKNLLWNERDKKFLNIKLFDQNFNFIYPSLVKED
ncbi:MAG: hypothetical protein ACP6IY_11250 [Promethearchaeia archaeon]